MAATSAFAGLGCVATVGFESLVRGGTFGCISGDHSSRNGKNIFGGGTTGRGADRSSSSICRCEYNGANENDTPETNSVAIR